ncbi:DNA-binding SARP family transcriptional activator/predicted negative regulator of RcsB-dependent stress response [Streptomyces aurantiacus]|nr:DNA-binding SARP family transcriptional activator/predicted negative regulator of RcsB-dependent stress response [Streptomyces aurantiacus]
MRPSGHIVHQVNTAYEIPGRLTDSLSFAVLGPVRAWQGERELDLGSPQQRAVLATLLSRRGRPVTVGELVDAVWGEEPPTAAVSVLRTYVSRLRKVLEPGRAAGEPPRVVVSAADGYLVRVPEGALDVGVFEARLAEAKKLRAAGEVSAAGELLHTALDEWEGTPLAGLPGPLAEAERSRLHEERLNTLETRLEIDVQLGRHSEAIAELTSLTGEHPLREQLCRLLMLALYRSGRQADALAAYRRTRSTLVTELGIEPGAPLRELHHRILAADRSLDPSPAARDGDPPETPADLPAWLHSPDRAATSVARPAQLPADLPTFTGRQAELEQTQALLPEDRESPATVVISAIDGMAAIGKTTLAVHWAHRIAHRFPDGQLFINLRGFDPVAPIVTPGEAIRTFLDALDVPPQRIPVGLDAQVALYRSLLANRRVLILLDNARDTDQVRPLLPGSPGSLVIVTSRNELTGLVAGDGAHPLTLNPLTRAEAHGFLAKRLGAERLAAEPQATEELIAHSARLPLALAIVAARAAANPGFPLSAITENLQECQGSLDAFAGGDITTDVRAVFSSSYNALSCPAARMFHLLGLHSGPDISAPAAAALAELPLREARGLLGELTRAHLLIEHRPGRYSLHDLLRVYATERVHAEETTQERERAVERLLTWYLHTAAAAYAQITPHRRRIPLEPKHASCPTLTFTTHVQALDWCMTERANLVLAVHKAAASGHPGIAWRLPAVLWGFFYLRSHMEDWVDTTRTGLVAAREAHDRKGEAQGLLDLAAALRLSGRLDEAIDHLHQAMALYRELGDRLGAAIAVSNLGDVYIEAGELGKAIEYIRRGLVIFRIIDSSWSVGIALSNLGDVYQRLGRFDEAIDCLEQALTVLRAQGNRWVEGVTLDVLGTVHHRLHRHDEAVETYHQAFEAHREVGNRWGEGHTLGHIGDAYLASGRPKAARTSWRLALAILEEFSHPEAEDMQEKLGSLCERLPSRQPGPVVSRKTPSLAES